MRTTIQVLGQLGAPVARRTVQRNLQLLRDIGLMTTVGRGANARWRIVG